LRVLEFLANDLNQQGAVALASACGNRLEHLGLRFEHPYIYDIGLSRTYWYNAPTGSPAWNALIGLGKLGKGIGMKTLRSLILERAGITPWQLQMLVNKNPDLKFLKLRTCSAVQPEFLDWLGGVRSVSIRAHSQNGPFCVPGASIEVLWLENCDGLIARDQQPNLCSKGVSEFCYPGLEWVRNLKQLKVSSHYFYNYGAHSYD